MAFITADQILAHMVGDYIIQSDWMATEKTKRSLAAGIHAVTYSLPFLFLTQDWRALAIIVGTHFIIDRWRLARYVIWLKERPWPGALPLTQMGPTGYSAEKPAWLSVWLLIIADNTLHVICNGIALLVFA